MEAVTAKTGVVHAASNAECAKQSEYVILAVKPQYFETVFEEICPVLKEDQIVISLAPGQTIASLTERLGGKVRVVRTMPNTPALLGEGMTGMAYEESNYSVKYGLPRAKAYQMAAQTVLGSAKMVLETGKHPGQLKDEVCSPGGTTIAGVSALEEWGFRNAVIKAEDASYEKGRKM